MRRTHDFNWFKVRWLPRYGWMLDRPAAVVVLAFSPDDRIWLARIERPPTATTSWEMPGGGVEPGESAVAAALRELKEECGLVSTKPARRLGDRFEVAPGMGTIPHYLVVVSGAIPEHSRPRPQTSEGIGAVRRFDAPAVRRMIASGKINALATMGALAASGWLERGSAQPSRTRGQRKHPSPDFVSEH